MKIQKKKNSKNKQEKKELNKELIQILKESSSKKETKDKIEIKEVKSESKDKNQTQLDIPREIFQRIPRRRVRTAKPFLEQNEVIDLEDVIETTPIKAPEKKPAPQVGYGNNKNYFDNIIKYSDNTSQQKASMDLQTGTFIKGNEDAFSFKKWQEKSADYIAKSSHENYVGKVEIQEEKRDLPFQKKQTISF